MDADGLARSTEAGETFIDKQWPVMVVETSLAADEVFDVFDPGSMIDELFKGLTGLIDLLIVETVLRAVRVTLKVAEPFTRLQSRNVIERFDEKQGQLIARFDDPDKAIELEAGPCIGDSGGPALIRVEGEGDEPATWHVAGVIANIVDVDEDRILGEYGDEFGMTSVANYADWIRETIGE